MLDNDRPRLWTEMGIPAKAVPLVEGQDAAFHEERSRRSDPVRWMPSCPHARRNRLGYDASLADKKPVTGGPACMFMPGHGPRSAP